MREVYIIGAKGIGNYGGYETFVKKLIEYHKNNDINYHIACKYNGKGSMNESLLKNVTVKNERNFIYCNADCFKIKIPNIGPAQAVIYDLLSLKHCLKHIVNNKISNPIIYILSSRIGIFLHRYKRRAKKYNVKIVINPDGRENLRRQYNRIIRMYWKLSERLMVKYSDLVICDSKKIEEYINNEYHKYNPITKYIAYGAELIENLIDDNNYTNWLNKNNIKINNYYLSVGRFVPDNNLDVIIKEFMKSNTKKDYVIITNENNKLYNQIKRETQFDKDSRIKFVGSVYDQDLLVKIRRGCYGYFHGHEVGGTNPSLLEAMSNTKLNLLYDVSYNREVGQDAALYWNKQSGNLSSLINETDNYSKDTVKEFENKSKKIIADNYSWNSICKKYLHVFEEI